MEEKGEKADDAKEADASKKPNDAKKPADAKKADDAKKRLFAHCYTRHMGDMMGGQILAKMVPGSGKLYQFPDKLELQGKIRARLTDDLVSEVKVAYKFAQKTFEQMMPYVKHEWLRRF